VEGRDPKNQKTTRRRSVVFFTSPSKSQGINEM
jgi:hypothetical protein